LGWGELVEVGAVDLEVEVACGEVLGEGVELGQGAGQAPRFGDDDGVAALGGVEGGGQLRAVGCKGVVAAVDVDVLGVDVQCA
jgi:hypothetical protein